MADRYANFAALSQHERENFDYLIEVAARDSRVAVIAPHGGFIEPNTTPIARRIAGNDLSFYSFTGLRPGRPHAHLHITSHRFDEPRCLDLVARSDIVITVHGMVGIDDPWLVYLGGLQTRLRERLRKSLTEAGFAARFDAQRYPGTHPSNICNRGRSGRGVQLELPRHLRDRLAADSGLLGAFSAAIRAAIDG
ncbi:poly-gamma-glutamate hydrolase family protein [Pseudorhodoplanes sp.]|uniref:poly-gamma-glutamate hydrolase family protein n=1 Tax=Pseudorhodoplanes sp. TaxID=1934341 RepID=UPI00391962A4